MDEETSNKAAKYDEEQIKKEAEQLDQLKPGEDLVALEKAFADADVGGKKREAERQARPWWDIWTN